jgi:hypothetical protein
LKNPFLLLFTLLVLASSCGYQFEGSPESKTLTTITVPYVQGDAEGKLTTELIHQLGSSGYFVCVQNGGEWILNVVISADSQEKIGYRYDRHGPEGKRRKRLVATENRRILAAHVSVIKSSTDELLIEPTLVSSDAEFDYINPDSIRDLTFVNSSGTTKRTLNFSLGQLDSIEGATDDVSTPLYRHLAQKIVDAIINQLE